MPESPVEAREDEADGVFMLIDQRIAVMGTEAIGFAVALAAADAGAEVLLGDNRRDRLDAAISRLPGRVAGKVVNVRDEEEVASFFEWAGEVDHVVSTIEPVCRPVEVCTVRQSDAEEILAGGFWGQFFLAKHAAARLIGNGSIALTSGIAARRPAEGFAIPASVHAAVEALVRVLALELAPLRVNAVCPGCIETKELPVPAAEIASSRQRMGRPWEAAQTYLYAMNNSHVTGQVLVVDGGACLMSGAHPNPSLLFS